MVVIYLGERAVVFPSEAAARFFYEAYNAVPALSGEVASLRGWLDEGALHRATGRVTALEAQLAQLQAEKSALETALTAEVARRTEAVRRATVLAQALRKVRESL